MIPHVRIALLALLLFLLLAEASVHDLPDINKRIPKQQIPAVFWMHIQKTSSWLGNFLILWGCPDLRVTHKEKFSLNSMAFSSLAKNNFDDLSCNVKFLTGGFGYGYHVPFSSEHNRSVVTLFRKPTDRVISMFLYGKGIHQMMFPIGFPQRIKRKFALRANISKSEFPILSYASLPGIAGCQMKMVLGVDCGCVREFQVSDLREAERRVWYDLAFVGLTEESEASANLFLAMYGNSSTKFRDTNGSGEIIAPMPDTHALAPRKNVHHTPELNSNLEAILLRQGWQDEYDNAIYKVAATVFYSRCKQYAIRTQYTLQETLSFLSRSSVLR